MTRATTTSHIILQCAPMALLELNSSERIIWINDAAVTMGFTVDTTLRDYCATVGDEKFLDYVRYQPDSHIYPLVFQGSEKRCRIRVQAEHDTTFLWLDDLSENLMMADRLRQTKRPEAKKDRQLSQFSATALGYAELLDVIMADAQFLSADKVDTIIKYQQEISSCLKSIHGLLHGEDAPVKRGRVLVAESHHALKELVSELLKAEGYKVYDFSDVDAAIKYCKLNADALDKAVIDESLIDADGCSLIDHVRAMQPDADVIPLVEGNSAEHKNGVSKPLDFKALLSALAES